jgi:predicted CoA-binding protein
VLQGGGEGLQWRPGSSHRQRPVATRRCGSGGLPDKLATVKTLLEVKRELQASSDPGNPTAEELRTILETVERIAVIGLSRHSEKPARRVPSYLAAKGYEVIPVNPNAERILGQTAYDRIQDVKEPVDMVLIFRPSEQAGRFVEDAAARPERPVIWLQSGIRVDSEAAAARAAGLTVVQDLCVFRIHRALFN